MKPMPDLGYVLKQLTKNSGNKNTGGGVAGGGFGGGGSSFWWWYLQSDIKMIWISIIISIL